MDNNINPKETDGIIISFLSKLLNTLEHLPFVYKTSGSETDINSNSAVISNAVTISGTATSNVENLTYIDGYAQQQMANQSSILQWCNTVRKKVV